MATLILAPNVNNIAIYVMLELRALGLMTTVDIMNAVMNGVDPGAVQVTEEQQLTIFTNLLDKGFDPWNIAWVLAPGVEAMNQALEASAKRDEGE